jgi:acylphosphatase
MPCIRCLVSGRVQGVFFRASTRERAQVLGLNGRVRNLPDGRVEVMACGPQAALESLQHWLWQGPSQSKVSDVQCTACPEEHDLRGFETG